MAVVSSCLATLPGSCSSLVARFIRLAAVLSGVLQAVHARRITTFVAFRPLGRMSGPSRSAKLLRFFGSTNRIEILSRSIALCSESRSGLSGGPWLHRHPTQQRTKLFSQKRVGTESKSIDESSATSTMRQTRNLAARLVEGSGGDVSSLQPMNLVVAVAGGGSSAASSIASTPGASSILLESVVTYDRRSYAEFVSANLEGKSNGSWLQKLDGSTCKDGDSSFSFCSSQSALLLSRSALSRSLQLTSSFQSTANCIGVGCTSSLVGKVSVEGDDIGKRKGRKSRAYIAVSDVLHGTTVFDIELDGSNLIVDGEEVLGSRRDRVEEDAVVSNLVLLALIRTRENLRPSFKIMEEALGRKNDRIEGRTLDDFPQKTPADGATEISGGNADAVAILPTRGGMLSLFSDDNIRFPRDVIIVPGSFNPPHQGHVGLANAAVKAIKKRNRKRLSEFPDSFSSTTIINSMWNKLSTESGSVPSVFFEMSVTNADKPPLDSAEVQRRVDSFRNISNANMPDDWAILLTNAPLFSQKTVILDNFIKSYGQSPTKMTFVLGADTMVRILNPKYYGNDRDNMIAALEDMMQKGVHFVVGGRLEQGTGGIPKFVNGQEVIDELPDTMKDSMFTLLSEDDFRLDISSTELRKKQSNL